MKHVVTAVTI